MNQLKHTINGKPQTGKNLGDSILAMMKNGLQNKLSSILNPDEFDKITVDFISDSNGNITGQSIQGPDEILTKIESVLGKTKRIELASRS